VKKRKKGVEGLASNKSIKTGGAVTVYSGYDAMTIAPKEKPAAEKPAAPTQVTGPAAVTQALQRQLPDGWEMRKSRSTGKTYYVNEKLGKSQFEPPAGSTIDKKADPKKKKAATRSKASSGDSGLVKSFGAPLGLRDAMDTVKRLQPSVRELSSKDPTARSDAAKDLAVIVKEHHLYPISLVQLDGLKPLIKLVSAKEKDAQGGMERANAALAL
ncbi:Kpna7, partial [Symbiodinium sp. KB8]